MNLIKLKTYLTYLLQLIVLALACLQACAPVPGGGGGSTSSAAPLPALEIENRQYLPDIRSVQLFPDDGTTASQLLPAVASLEGQNQLVLHFDDMQQDRTDYFVKIIHCDYNWEVSRLSTLEYLYDYNEFNITDFSFSYNTRKPYVHYQFPLPQVKLSGNYLLVVYRNRDPNDLVLSRRFMVFENLAGVKTHLVAAPGGARYQRQQIDLDVLYRSLPGIVDPLSQIRVVIRQNQRWDNAIYGLRATGDRTGTQTLEYQLFDLSNTFPGGNEFRFFDLRTVRASGQNVGTVRLDSVRNMFDAFLMPDKPRGNLPYAQRDDLNGNFVIANQDFTDPYISGEYVDVHFFLKLDQPLAAPVYVAGDFSNYQRSSPYIMKYDTGLGGYRTDIRLKQGWYNYIYLVGQNENALTLEGTFSETENFYEVFVYYRPNTKPADLLVGYSTLSTGLRR